MCISHLFPYFSLPPGRMAKPVAPLEPSQRGASNGVVPSKRATPPETPRAPTAWPPWPFLGHQGTFNATTSHPLHGN